MTPFTVKDYDAYILNCANMNCKCAKFINTINNQC